MSDNSCRSWIIVSAVSRYSVESETSRPSVPVRFAIRDITVSADTSTRTRLSWFLCAASMRSSRLADAAQRGRQVGGGVGEQIGALAQVRPHVAEHGGLIVRHTHQTLSDLPKIADRASQLHHRLRVES